MARNKSTYYDDPNQPGLFSDSMLGESPLNVADSSSPSENDTPFAPLNVEANVAAEQTDTIFYMSFGSGSSGNCSYIGDKRSGFLVDAGIDPTKVESALKAAGITMEQVRGIVLTHDHGDHVRYVYSLLRNHRHMKVYCTPKILNGML